MVNSNIEALIREKHRAHTKKAKELKAFNVLIAHLTPEQRKTFLEKGYFTVRGNDGVLWHIHFHTEGNVYREPGRAYWCFLDTHPDGSFSIYSKLLAQKLWIETMSEQYRDLSC